MKAYMDSIGRIHSFNVPQVGAKLTVESMGEFEVIDMTHDDQGNYITLKQSGGQNTYPFHWMT